MNLGMPEMIFLLILAFIIFGPGKLPEIARTVGRALAEFKRASNDFQSQLADEVRKLESVEEGNKILPTAAPTGTVALGAGKDAETPPSDTPPSSHA